jgi:hypothetical protein
MRVSLVKLILPSIALSVWTGVTASAHGQNVYQDYRVQRTGAYSPEDPWIKGRVFRTHTGHDGLFYNCDNEEEKRCSSWIRWGQRPCDDLLSPTRIRGEFQQSYCDALERLRLGSCQESCGLGTGTGYPPGAGYGNELSTNRAQSQPNDIAPEPVGTPNATPSNSPPPAPQPILELGRRSRTPNASSVVDLPPINHLRPTPRL